MEICDRENTFVISKRNYNISQIHTLCVASEGGIASNSKGSTDYQRRAYRHVGDPRPVSQRRLLQRTVDEEAVVVADKG